jgi:tRNA (guanine-N7-)-methyltransferase
MRALARPRRRFGQPANCPQSARSLRHVSEQLPPRPHLRFTEEGRRVREVLSYSRRGNRLTLRQQEAWAAHHQAWVIPDEAVDVPGFSLASWFGRTAPVIVEIGSGVGEAIAALAAQRPEADILAFEVWRPGVAQTLELLADVGAENVRLLGVDAMWALEHLFAADTIEELWTFFPDPWPKKRHHKRRLVSASFATLIASRLRPGGVWRLATDWQEYAEQMRAVLDAEPGLEGGVVDRWTDRPMTRFERKGLAAGRTIVDLAYNAR